MKQKDKTNFRNTAKWKKFRVFKKAQQNNIDPITLSKLYKGWNLHHLNLNADEYTNIDNPDDFVGLNKMTHDMLHWLYNYYKKDPKVLERIKFYLDSMVTLSCLFDNKKK